MQNLIIEGKKEVYFIPQVRLDAETGICEISGESYLEETKVFYQDILDWLRTYMTEVGRSIVFNFNLDYFNTSSSKSILQVLRLLKDYEEAGGNIDVNWYYQEGDIDMLEEIEDYKEETEIDINIIAVDKIEEEQE